jgi:hypothetical protein
MGAGWHATGCYSVDRSLIVRAYYGALASARASGLRGTRSAASWTGWRPAGGRPLSRRLVIARTEARFASRLVSATSLKASSRVSGARSS